MVGGKASSCVAVNCSDIDKKGMLAKNFLYIGENANVCVDFRQHTISPPSPSF